MKMRIVINGKPVEHAGVCISYEEVVSLAGETGTPTVTYCSRRDGDIRRQGCMYKGCSPVLLSDVMSFSVIHTGGA